MSPVRLEMEVLEHRRLLCGERPLPLPDPIPKRAQGPLSIPRVCVPPCSHCPNSPGRP